MKVVQAREASFNIYFENVNPRNETKNFKNDSLKSKLSQWTGELNDLKEDVVIRREHWLNHLLPIINTYIPTRNSDKYAYRPDYERDSFIKPMDVPLKNYKEFINSLEVDGKGESSR